MKINGIMPKKQLLNNLRRIGALRVKTNHGTILSLSALCLILFIAFTIRILPMRWEISTGQLRLSEFDPYYQFSLTKHMVEEGVLSPYWPGWTNLQSWYPGGLDMSVSLPSLPMTTAIAYNIISALGINVELMTFCAIMPAFLGTLACLLLYFIGKDLGGKSVGLFSSLFLALSPSFIQRTSLGFFDTESVGVFALLLFLFTFLRAIEENRTFASTIKYSVGAGAALAFFICGWGAAYYVIGLALLFVLSLIVLKRYSQKLFVCYSVTFGIGIFTATIIPRFSTSYLFTAPILATAVVFVLLCILEIWRLKQPSRNMVWFAAISLVIFASGFFVLLQLGYMQDIAGKFLSVLNPLLRSEQPLLESVAEHRITPWGSIYLQLGIGIIFFLAGLYFTLKNPTNRNVFLLLFGMTALYFAGSMVRLLSILAPAFSLLAAVGILGILKPFYTLLRTPEISKKGLKRVGREYSGIAVLLVFLLIITNLVFSPQNGGMPRVYSQAYSPITVSTSSLPFSLDEPIYQWLDMFAWTKNNLESTTKVAAWWDYGYWLTNLGNVTSLADNATINATQIENLGFSFMANETLSLKMLEKYDVEYILVFTTLGITTDSTTTGQYKAYDLGYGDEGKWQWMARISGGARDRFVQEGMLNEENAWTDEFNFGNYNNETGDWEWNNLGMNSTINKLMSWAKQRYSEYWEGLLTADVEGVEPIYFKEAFFSGLELSPFEYGGLVPLVCLYEIDWESYHSQNQLG